MPKLKTKPKSARKATCPAAAILPDPLLSLADLKADPKNARRHTPRNVGIIAESLQRVGAARSIVIDENGIVLAGNGVVEAAGEIGMERVRVIDTDGTTIIAVRRSGLTDKQKAQLAIADNRANELSAFDPASLSALADEVGIDLTDEGFTLDEIAGLANDLLAEAGKGEVVEDEIPTNVPTRCKPGELWKLDGHRLLCGDSTKAEDVARVMGGEKASLCFTSPPYAQQRDYTAESQVKDWDGLMQGVFSNLPTTDDGQVLVNLGVVHNDGEWLPYWDAWIEWMRSAGWRRFGLYCWDQGHGLPGDWNGRCAPSFELIFHFNKVAVKATKWVDKLPESVEVNTHGTGIRAKNGKMSGVSSPEASLQLTKLPDNVWRIMRHKARDIKGHPAMFPVELPAHAMKTWPGNVYEPFCGSGTTLIAAEQLGRRCFGIEISPAYCDIILARWEKLTGKTAERIEC